MHDANTGDVAIVLFLFRVPRYWQTRHRLSARPPQEIGCRIPSHRIEYRGTILRPEYFANTSFDGAKKILASATTNLRRTCSQTSGGNDPRICYKLHWHSFYDSPRACLVCFKEKLQRRFGDRFFSKLRQLRRWKTYIWAYKGDRKKSSIAFNKLACLSIMMSRRDISVLTVRAKKSLALRERKRDAPAGNSDDIQRRANIILNQRASGGLRPVSQTKDLEARIRGEAVSV
eukprot:284817933_4